MDELEIFTEALAHLDSDERTAYLERACGPDIALRGRIEKLLALHDSDRSLLDRRPHQWLTELNDPNVTSPYSPAHASGPLTSFFLPSDRPDALGRLGHYHILEELGQGGFGVVVKAFDEKLHRVVAIKVLAPHLALTSPPRKRFLREARAAAQIKHANVVQIYAVEEEPIPHLVMEFVEGQTLQQRIDSAGPLDFPEVVRIGQEIALGLAAAHEKGFIHRDIKPANILREASAEACTKVTDFGLARAADDASLTQSGVIVGTPLFMSPEQANNEELDARSDLFSLGSVLYALTTGHPPFRAATTLAVLKRVCEDTPRPIHQVIEDVPEGLCAVIARLMAKDRAARFATARDVVEALARCLDAPPPAVAPPAVVAPPPAAAPPPAVSTWILWIRRVALGVAIALFSALVAWGTAVWQGRAGGTQGPFQEDVLPRTAPSERFPKEEVVDRTEAEIQRAAVVAELRRLYPEFEEQNFRFRVMEDGDYEVSLLNADAVRSLAPLRALTRMKRLLVQAPQYTGLSDLEPLRGMALTQVATIGCKIRDLSPLAKMPLDTLFVWPFEGNSDQLSVLRGMPLKELNIGRGAVKDLSSLRGLRLELLCVSYTQVEDLTPLAGMPLKTLQIEGTQVRDLTPLKGMKLETLHLTELPLADFTPLQNFPLRELRISNPVRHANLLRTIRTLQTINDKDAKEVLRVSP